MLLALDISLTTGWAFGGPTDPAPTGGVWRFQEGKHNFPRALVSMRQSVLRVLCNPGITHMVVEAPMLKIDRWHSAYSLYMLVSLGAVAREVAQERGVPLTDPASNVWRKAVHGHGNLSTDDAKRAAETRCKQLGWSFVDDNEAEAKCIWYHTATQLWPKWPPAKVPVKRKAA